jgi:putative aldouronate transport system substrate-binding protein
MKAGARIKGAILCLLALVLVPLLAACGGSPNANTNANGPVDLNVWISPAVPEVGPPPADWETYKIIKQKLNINLKLTLLPIGDDGTTKMNAAASANDLPDLFQVTDQASFRQWVNLGLVGPIDGLLPLMPQRTKDRYSDPTLLKLGTINGKPYILQESTPLTKRAGLFIRKDWLDKLGLKAPTTLDEFLNVAKAFTFNDPDGNKKNDTYGYGAAVNTAGTGLGFGFIYGAYGLPGPWNYNTPGKLSLSVRDPGYLQGTQFLKQLQDAKVIDPDWTTIKYNDFRARWKQGKYGMFVDDFAATLHKANYEAFDKNFPDGELVPLNPPKGPDGKSAMGTFVNVGVGLAVSQKAVSGGKSQAIAKFLEWVNSGEGYYQVGFGKEGVNYKLDAQGNISDKDVPVPTSSHEAAPYVQMRWLAYKGTSAELNFRYPAYQTQKGRPMDPMQGYRQIAAMPWQDVTRSQLIPPASNQADINRYINEHLVQFITGQKPLTTESWNTFVKGLDALNVAEWEAAAEKALKDQGLLS